MKGKHLEKTFWICLVVACILFIIGNSIHGHLGLYVKFLGILTLCFIGVQYYVSAKVEETRKNADSHYSYYVTMYDRYLGNKIKHYIIKYKFSDNDKLHIMGDSAMNEEEVRENFKANHKAGTIWAGEIIDITEGEATIEYIKEFNRQQGVNI